MPGHEGAIVFSQVCARDFMMYLLAAKSFSYHTRFSRFAIFDDGSLTDGHRALLHHHLPGIAISHVSEVRSDVTPRGGTWERLLKMAMIGERAYVIQLDADTVTLGPIDKVRDSVEHGRAFTLTSEPDARIVSTTVAAAHARCKPQKYLQHAAESQLDTISSDLASNYFRGCSGFTGLPPMDRKAIIEGFSRRMAELMGKRWSEWGTEQVTVNVLTANSPGLAILAPPIYSTYEARPLPAEAKFVHFMGTHRFADGIYRRLATQAIRALHRAPEGALPQPVPA